MLALALGSVLAFFTPAAAGPTGDRLVLGEVVYELDMPSDVEFERAKTFKIHNDLLLVPAESKPLVGVWRLGKFSASLATIAKTSCDWKVQQNYYLPGNNREERENVTVEECRELCCSTSWCLSFDYAKEAVTGYSANTCWLSSFREPASGLTWDDSGKYEYHEVQDGQELSFLNVMTSGTNPLIVGFSPHSGDVFQFHLNHASSDSHLSLSSLGPFLHPSGAAAHEKPVLISKIANWAEGERLLTGGYDRALAIWKVVNDQLELEALVSGTFKWPIWSLEPASTRKLGIFVAGNHANISRMELSDQSNLTSWTEVQNLVQHSRLVRALAFTASSDGILASGSEDNRIVLWRRVPEEAVGDGVALNDFQYSMRLFDHVDAVTGLTFITPAVGGMELLTSSSADSNVMFFNPQGDTSTCAWQFVANYYLPGNNRYELQDTPLDECKRICCDSPWCLSFDYARYADPGGQHPAHTCWLSTYLEGPSGLQWDSSGIYEYWEIKKKGTRMLTLEQTGPVQHMAYAAAPTDLIAVARTGTQARPGGLVLTKVIEVVCQDGFAPNFAGTECEPCRLGYAGTGGVCDSCPPGRYAQHEGAFECSPCPPGWASSITELPDENDWHLLEALPKCTMCPPWALAKSEGHAFCDWCPPGQMANEDHGRQACIGVKKGAKTSWPDWGSSWGRDQDEREDAFCPTARFNETTECRYHSDTIASAVCPMTCPRYYQVEKDANWHTPPPRDPQSYQPYFPPVEWICTIQDQEHQEQCNQLLCMGAMVKMQGDFTKKETACDQSASITDCTCAESLREACKGGLTRLRQEQCQEQCSQRWCELMCEDAAAREFTGIFTDDLVENPFAVTACEAVPGEKCQATCANRQRRVVVQEPCGKWLHYSGGDGFFDYWGAYQITNDALCGGDSSVETVCTQGKQEDWELYRPAACIDAAPPRHAGLGLGGALLALLAAAAPFLASAL